MVVAAPQQNGSHENMALNLAKLHQKKALTLDNLTDVIKQNCTDPVCRVFGRFSVKGLYIAMGQWVLPFSSFEWTEPST